MSPLLMWVFPIPFLIPIVMSAELSGGLLLLRQWQVHSEDRLRLWRMLFFSAVFLPIGIWIERFIPVSALKISTSAVVMFFAVYLMLKPHFRLVPSRVLDSLTGSLSGLLLGSCGIGGPPAALYLNATEQAFDRARSLLSQFVSGISLFAIVAASLMGGGVRWLSYLPIVIPAYFLGIKLAEFILRHRVIPDISIKRVCLGILIGNAGFNLLLLFIYK